MKRRAQKSNLTAEQRADAERLRDLIESQRERPDWPGLDEFAARSIRKSGSYLSQLRNGYRPLNLEAAVGLAREMRVSIEAISPTLAKEAAEIAEADPRTARISVHGMQTTPEEVEFGIEWGKLEEPLRSSIREHILVLVANQKRKGRETRAPMRKEQRQGEQ